MPIRSGPLESELDFKFSPGPRRTRKSGWISKESDETLSGKVPLFREGAAPLRTLVRKTGRKSDSGSDLTSGSKNGMFALSHSLADGYN